MASNNELNNAKKDLEKMFQDYSNRIAAIKRKQDELLDDFVIKLEKAKIEELTNKLKI